MEINGFGAIMTREELQNKFGDAICEYYNKNIISEYNIGIGCFAKVSFAKKQKIVSQMNII